MNERLVGHMVGRLISNREEHEEVCQDVFLKVFNKLSEFNFQAKLSTWIGTIAYRHAINAMRKSKIPLMDLPDDDNLDRFFVDRENPEEILGDKDMDDYVLELVEKLPAQYKLVLTLYHVQGLNYSEIGEMTGMPEGTVKNYLFRARRIYESRRKTSKRS
jgi:RNA polymerase sigma-70 factor (ECF subfamily)